MRLAAVDYGDTRTGVAISDLTGTLSGETFVITEKDQRTLVHRVAQALADRGVTEVAVGNPVNMDGSQGPRSEKCKKFGTLLASVSGLPVTMIDERRTTVDAHRILTETGVFGKKRKACVDAVAASLILEVFMGRRG